MCLCVCCLRLLQVVRTTHPPDQAPHGVASNPAPTYVHAPYLKQNKPRYAAGPGHLSQPNPTPPPLGRQKGTHADAYSSAVKTYSGRLRQKWSQVGSVVSARR